MDFSYMNSTNKPQLHNVNIMEQLKCNIALRESDIFESDAIKHNFQDTWPEYV
jgi:hypothetical protein